jgi:hypothetical protein
LKVAGSIISAICIGYRTHIGIDSADTNSKSKMHNGSLLGLNMLGLERIQCDSPTNVGYCRVLLFAKSGWRWGVTKQCWTVHMSHSWRWTKKGRGSRSSRLVGSPLCACERGRNTVAVPDHTVARMSHQSLSGSIVVPSIKIRLFVIGSRFRAIPGAPTSL